MTAAAALAGALAIAQIFVAGCAVAQTEQCRGFEPDQIVRNPITQAYLHCVDAASKSIPENVANPDEAVDAAFRTCDQPRSALYDAAMACGGARLADGMVLSTDEALRRIVRNRIVYRAQHPK